jgi:hypothetical protein
MNKPCSWIKKISRPAVLLSLIVLYLFIILGLFPAFATDAYASPLDLMFHYSPDQAYALIESYGPEVRHSYAISALTLDVIYPLTYSLLFSVWLSMLLKGPGSLKCAVVMLPFVILLFDLLENSGIVVMLLNYPQRLDTLAQLTAMATSLKWVFAITVILLTLALSLWRLGQYLFRNKLNSS